MNAIFKTKMYPIIKTQFRSKTRALLLAFSAAFAVTCVAAESVPYDLRQETYKTETLFSYAGCLNHQLMGNSGQPVAFKNHVYLTTIAYGLHPRILQVSLDGGEARIGRLDPDYYIGEDSHRYFTLSVDKAGYIHVVGGMHGGPWQHWISAKPEDVSQFDRTVTEESFKEPKKDKPEVVSKSVPAVTGEKGPPGYGITYPAFNRDAAGNIFLYARGSAPDFRKGRQGKIVHIGLLSTYDAATRDWRLLGADIPQVFGGHSGHPVTVWGDCFENGAAGGGWYVKNTAFFVAAPDNTLHFLFHILNYASATKRLGDIEVSKHAVSKDILYAWSKDGGRTLQRADGSNVQWPVCAKAGPYQADVIYAAYADYAAMEKAGDGKFTGLVGGKIQLDWKGRPMIQAHNNKTNADVVFRVENGKWVSCPAQAFGQWRDNAGVLMDPIDRSGDVIRRWDESHSRVVKLGQEIENLDKDYLRDTGTMIYTTKSKGKGNSVINIVRTTIQRPATPKSN